MLQQPSFDLFRKSVNESIAPLVFITGSGLSKPAGLPDWRGLRDFVQSKLNQQYIHNASLNTSFSDPRYKRAERTNDYWDFFQLSQDILGRATYNGIIRETLDIDFGEIPGGYRKLFELEPRGVVTLNLDRVTGEAFAENNRGAVIPVYGSQIAQKWAVIRDEKSFLVYLHGHVHDHETWVLTSTELEKLRSSQGHGHFLKSMYLDYTVLFVGISADDIAISSPLVNLKEAGFSAPRVFWLTSRVDAQSDAWAKENDVQKISYKANSEAEHLATISQFVDQTKGAKSQSEKKIPPTIDARKHFGANIVERDPRKLANYDSEDVRTSLSNILAERLSGLSGDAVYDAFDNFCKEYRYPIQTKSFYKDGAPPDNVFFGYHLHFPELGSGNFGEAYSATNLQGEAVCIKVMHNSIVNNREMIGGFRRGGRSLSILTKHCVDGVVRIRETFEMPPTIVMDLVSGNSLQELFSELTSCPWHTKIRIVKEIAEIVSKCHKLPEMVLHRDIKPSNIMLEGLDYSDYHYTKLYVLDFDMSWHKNSSEKDIIFESRDDLGYLAPEQTDPSRAVTTRSAKVDSYGLGMTAFALFGGRHPAPGWTMAADWPQRVESVARQGYKLDWRCLPMRAARTVLEATRVEQADRLDFTSLARRFERMYPPSVGENENAPIDIIAEEVLAIIADGQKYVWDDIEDRGHVRFANGTSFFVEVENSQKSLQVKVRFEDTGAAVFQAKKQLLGEAKDLFDTINKRDEYRIKRTSIANSEVDLIASVSIGNSLAASKECAYAFQPSIDRLRRI